MNAAKVFMAGEGAGRSGSFFFFSHDSKFIIKTMTDYELGIYLLMLPDYLKHITQDQLSLLAPIIGVFTLETPHAGKLNFMLM